MRHIHIEIDLETEELWSLIQFKNQLILKITSIFFCNCDIKRLKVEEK